VLIEELIKSSGFFTLILYNQRSLPFTLLMKKLILISAVALILTSCGNTTQYSNLTACLQKNQVVMFGASWCPHCASQKKLFGKSVKELPYFECSKNGEQVKECNDRAISSYPTWQFPEDVLKKLPETALTNLYNTELAKVRSSIK
jgi:thiol-disulfide isomerase/thioredoxin